ncbi:MAG: hypothetical protein IPM96_05540 [Ignavibacteria bacterium]|nr:hypothetical protein [Ignavibacteria bacterium]
MKIILITFFFISSIIISGCGNKDENSGKDGKESGNKTSETQNNDLTQKTEEQIKEDANKEAGDETKTENELGMKPGLPSDFPKDIPQPKDSKVLGSLTTSEGTVVTFESNTKVLEIVEFYKEEMKKSGYTLSEEGESLVTDKGGLINWTKDSKTAGLMLGYDKDKNITSLVITYN